RNNPVDPARGKQGPETSTSSRTNQKKRTTQPRSRAASREGAPGRGVLAGLLAALRAARQGDFSVRLRFGPDELNGSNEQNGEAENGKYGKYGAARNGHAKNGDRNGQKNGHTYLNDAPGGPDAEVMRAIAGEFNAMVALNESLASEMIRVERVVGREGRMTERVGL